MDRPVPFDKAAEEATIGSILINDSTFRSMAFLSPKDFFTEPGRLSFEAATNLSKRGEPIDQITLAQELERQNYLTKIGGAGYLSHLLGTVPTSLDAEYYARIVRRLSVSRSLIVAGSQISNIGYSAEPDENGSIAKAENLIKSLRTGDSSQVKDSTSIGDGILSMLEDNRDGKNVISWGFRDLDRLTGGISKGDYIILGARPSTGKTEIMCQEAIKQAQSLRPVVIVSMEMTDRQMNERLCAIVGGVPVLEMRSGNPEIQNRMVTASGEISQMPIKVMYGRRTVADMRANLEKILYDTDVKLVVVDYLTKFLDVYDKKCGDNMTQRAGYVSASLFSCCKDLGIPMLVAAQLSRGVEYRESKRPVLADLRESGEIEQDADMVFMLHRPALYDPNDKPNVLEMLHAKNRAIGAENEVVNLVWDKERHVYQDYSFR